MNDETLVPVFMPPLVTILAQHERQKGSPLTEDEVIAIRGKSVVMMMRQFIAILAADWVLPEAVAERSTREVRPDVQR